MPAAIRKLAVLLALLALTAGNASGLEPSLSETRIRGFDLGGAPRIGSEGALSRELHWGIDAASTTLAPDSLLAAEAGAARVAPLGRGSTANGVDRWLPRNLREQLAVEEAMQNAAAGRRAAGPLGDARWPASDGWVKMQQTIDPGGREGPLSVHYNFNTETGAVDDFKLVFRAPYAPAPEPAVPSWAP